MSNPQWKSFQPPITSSSNSHQDIIDLQATTQTTKYRNGSFSSEFPSSPRDSFANISCNSSGRFSMGTFNTSETNSYQANDSFNSSSSNNSQQYEPPPMLPNRETGIIEKLLHSYGFIQCCERQARLFFHFSQFSGNIEHLKIGDPVEFEMTYDRRTGKPIASTVTKIAPEVVLSEARVTGTVTTELRSDGSNADTTGRISYENRGECFFLPYTKDDVEGNVTLHAGDAVSFQIATNQRGNLGACHVRLENPAHPVKYHGVVCSMKESFGFIERADVVKEIFFHFSEAKTKDEINLGDDVEFIIQTRNGKEVACYITRLPTGSVIFEDVLPEIIKGQVLKPLERGSNNRHLNDPLPGRIRYRAPDHSEADVQFGDKDQCGEFTLRHGDWVQFQVAIDRRDGLKRATNISLLDESFQMSGERREMGIVSSLKDGFGFIKCVEREPHLFFHFSEVLQPGQTLNIGDEVEFTLDPVTTLSASQQPSAKRIKHLPKGTVQFETVIERGVQGVVSKEAILRTNSPTKQAQDATGLLTYQVNGAKKSLTFFAKDVLEKSQPRQGDRVVFDICQVKRTKEMIGMNITAQQITSNGNCLNTNMRTMLQGFIAALKDGFGFIETKEHDKEVFFRFSNFEGSVDTLELGRDVEYIVSRQQQGGSGGPGGGCSSAELVRALPKGTIPLAKATNLQLQGTVTRALRALNPDQLHYSGIIDASNGMTYEFGVMGLTCKRDLFRVGDLVSFSVDTENRAVNIIPMRKKRRAIVDSIKGAFGFLSFEIEEGKKLIFYMSEVNGSPSNLSPGDLVEFTLVTYHNTGKSLACNVTKVIDFDGDTPETIRAFDSMRRRSDSFEIQEPSRLKIQSHQTRNNDRSNSQNTGFKNMKSYSADQPQLPGIAEGNNVSLSQNEGRSSNHSINNRIKKRAKVDSLKVNAGFIEESDGKKVIFYMSEVRPPYNLQAGDTVEYQTMTNRNGKVTAVNVTKVVDGVPMERPEHLKTRRRTASLDEQSGPRFQIIRKPRGPDGSRGFRPRVPLHVLIADTSIQ